jgi:5-methylcytosine-specific restriction endonuclease McrA
MGAFYVRCSHPGCNALTRNYGGRCDLHRIRHRHNVIREDRESDRVRYNNEKWRAFSQSYRRAHPLCVNFEQCGNATTLVDHITRLRLGGAQYDVSNMQPMCDSCHNKKRQEERFLSK